MRLFLLLLFAGLVSAQYAEPPLDAVMDGNLQLATSLGDAYNSSLAVNTTVDLEFGSYTRSIPVSSSIEILALSPSIDGMSCAVGGLSVLIARGERMGELIALPSEGYPDFGCDAGWYAGPKNYAWRCDFDTDSCVEYVNRSRVLYEELEVTFTFRNLSIALPFSSTAIPVPEELLDEMDSASGNDSLLVQVSGDMVFFYEVNDRGSGFGGDCGSNRVLFNSSIPFSLNRSFSVGGNRKLFFLRSPVLREQWHRDNRFDVIALSQCPLYRAEIYENGALAESMVLRTFSIATDRHGVASLLSDSANATAGGWSEGASAVASPFQLEHEDVSYLFAYVFEYGYTGLGDNNLSITVHDIASHDASFNETLTSRMLSYGGAYAEDGSPIGSVPVRPSIAPAQDSLIRIEIAFGLIALILIAAFVNSWLLGKY